LAVLFARLASGSTLDEILAEFPTLQRAVVVEALRQAQVLVSQSAEVRKDTAHDPWVYAVQRARETCIPGRTPTITEHSPGVVYARAIRNARRLGYLSERCTT
jgi:hypothetical protein